MARRASMARRALRAVFGEAAGTPKLVREGRRLAYKEEGGGSLFAWPIIAAARKLKGGEAVNRALFEKYHRPLKNVDERLGRLLSKELGTKKLFRQVDVLPTRRTMGRGKHRTHIEHETHSATAPLTKAVKVVTPIAATLYAADLLNKIGGEAMAAEEQTQEASPSEDKNELLKEAADALELAQRHEDAVKLAFTMVEKGKIPPFESYEEFTEKVASLLTKDLRVVEEAIEMDATMADFGKVASDGGSPTDPESSFFHRLAEE